jgi:hypothetical protein
MSTDFIENLAKGVRAKEEAGQLADAAMLHRAAIRDRKFHALFGDFRTSIRQQLDKFNSERGMDAASIPRESSEEIAVDFQGKRIFLARSVEGVVTKLQFFRDSDEQLAAFTISMNQKEEVLIIDKDRAAVTDAEELAKKALAFMFAPYSA